MSYFSVGRSNVAPTANKAMLIYEVNTGQRSRLVEVTIHALGAVSGINEIIFARVSGGSGYASGPTPEALEPEARGAGGQTYINQTGEPTVSNIYLRAVVNSDTGFFHWLAPPWTINEEYEGILTVSQNRTAVIPIIVDPGVTFSFNIVMDCY